MKHIREMVLCFFLLPLLSVSIMGCEQSGNAHATISEEPKKVKVSVTPIVPTPIMDYLVLPGTTKPYLDITLSADTGGIVEWVGFKEGDRVKKGDLIVKIDVSALKAQLDNAKADFELADRQHTRRKNLFARKIISREELDQSGTVRSVRSGALRQAKVQYENAFIEAPIDGVINVVHVDPGEFIGRGAPVVELVNVDRIEVEVNVPEMDVKYFKPGQQVGLGVDAMPGRQFLGNIDFVSFKADPLTKTFRVKVLLDNPDDSIRPGMIVRVALLRRVVPDALVAPLFALVDKGGERLVFVEEDGVARSRAVSLGVIDRESIQITEGLKSGDHLIVSGQNDVEDGIRVEPL